jgi:hypothetical protein
LTQGKTRYNIDKMYEIFDQENERERTPTFNVTQNTALIPTTISPEILDDDPAVSIG